MLYHARQVKIAYSLDFLWHQQAEKELDGIKEMHRHTNQLLQNILPIHVADYFLKQDRKFNELYAQGKCQVFQNHFIGVFSTTMGLRVL